MNDGVVRIMLVEDNASDVQMVAASMRAVEAFQFDLLNVTTLAGALLQLARGADVDVVVLDLSLSDSHGWNTFARLHSAFPNVPIVILTSTNDQAFAVKAIRSGAKDFLVKGQISGRWLVRALQLATCH